MNWKVTLSDIDYGIDETHAVLNVLLSKWLTMGDITREFERQFSRFIGVKHAIAVSNGTEALHLACLALGIGPGDEVIVPSLSFVATSNAVLYTGAEVCFADTISLDNLTIDPEDIAAKITPRTKAIIVMHYAGYPCQMTEILDIADRFHLPVIEDASHAVGASFGNKMVGALGTVGCFSFFSNKNLATGEGGMLATDNDHIAARARSMRSHGMTTSTLDRHRGHSCDYDVLELGYNYRIDEMRSALGIVQLKKLAGNNRCRAELTQQYQLALADCGVEIPFRVFLGRPAYHIFPILLPDNIDRRIFMDELKAQGIQTSIHYPPTHCFTYYRVRYGSISLPKTEDISAREVTLPLYPIMGTRNVDLVVENVIRAIEKQTRQ